jgi:RNA polymerase sigma-70 factor (ECF subfamily)
VCQEVFKAVAQKIGEFRHESPQDSFRGWLWAITQNKINDLFKQSERWPIGEGGSDAQARLAQVAADDADDEVSLSEEKKLLYRQALGLLMSDFKPNTVEAFLLSVVEELPARTVAERLKVSVQAVYNARARVPKRLREEFGELLNFERLTQRPSMGDSQERGQ